MHPPLRGAARKIAGSIPFEWTFEGNHTSVETTTHSSQSDLNSTEGVGSGEDTFLVVDGMDPEYMDSLGPGMRSGCISKRVST